MKKKFTKYFFITLIIAFSFWFYFQASTFPYKVDRWFQPLEASLVSINARHCLPANSWLKVFVEHAVNFQGAYSAQVAFIDAEENISSCEIGYKDELFGIHINASNRYRYASTSKLITAAAVLTLADQGRLSLEDTLVSFLPELKEYRDVRIRQITLAHLLNHRAGFNRLAPNGDPLFMRHNKPWCPNDLGKLQAFKLSFEPGKKQAYSNMGYCLLGEVIHRITGKGFRDYIEHEFSLAKYNIKFVNNYYYDDEVRYDYRYEEWFNDSYLKLFDFDAISSAAGLSGSATSMAQLLWDLNRKGVGFPFSLDRSVVDCDLKKVDGCMNLGVNHYQPEKYGISLHYHQGYLPGSASFAIVDSFGGVTVLVKSGANRYQKNPQNEWIRWTYGRLSLYYTLQGKLPILNSVLRNQ